jgi:sortase A
VLLLLALQQIAGAGLVQAKAWLAPVLIERAWQRSLALGGEPVRPWPWADTWPVARLQAPALGRDVFVLYGDSGNALAFGPGHSMGSAPLGSAGRAVIGGHRDTHFAFLRSLAVGERLRLQLPDTQWREYRVYGTSIANADREPLQAPMSGERLTLVTCYPFDAVRPGGPLRYVVDALPSSQS